MKTHLAQLLNGFFYLHRIQMLRNPKSDKRTVYNWSMRKTQILQISLNK